MGSFEDRQDEVQRSLIPGRLLRGSAILGQLSRGSAICPFGWSTECRCIPRLVFCSAKERFTTLARLVGREIGSGLFAIIEAMTLREFEASGLTVTVEFPGGDRIQFGPKGTPWKLTWPGLFDDAGQPSFEAVKAVARVQTMV